LQNELQTNLLASLIAEFPQGIDVAFSSVPVIPTLSPLLKDEVRNTFGEALKVVWQALLGISIAGFLFSRGMRQVALHSKIDKDWGRSDVTLPLGLKLLRQSTNMRRDAVRIISIEVRSSRKLP
jgi:hypothetical protein